MKHIKSHKLFESNMILTEEEKKWLESWLESCNQQWGFEPRDHEMKESIFTKLGFTSDTQSDEDWNPSGY